eukprot:5093074-Prymnesium_polylepis.1
MFVAALCRRLSRVWSVLASLSVRSLKACSTPPSRRTPLEPVHVSSRSRSMPSSPLRHRHARRSCADASRISRKMHPRTDE